jgi:hypothetical protein
VDPTASVAVALPVDAGAKVAVNVTLWFGESVIGKLSPPAVKSVPLMFADEMVTEDALVLVSVSERLELFPSCTLPKASVDGDAARVVPPLEPPAGATPWQPLSSTTPLAMKREVKKQRRDRRTCKAKFLLNASIGISVRNDATSALGVYAIRVGPARLRRCSATKKEQVDNAIRRDAKYLEERATGK